MKRFATLLSLSLLVVALLATPSTYGQPVITNYVFSASSGTFTPLSGATAPSLSGGTLDDGWYNGIPIGFTFYYMGVPYTTLAATTNGFLAPGATLSSSHTVNALTAGVPRPVIAPLWDDLDQESFGTFSYKTEGTPGSRIFTAEWLNYAWNFSATAAVISFQAKLYEATGILEFVYRQEAAAVVSGSASIGISATATGAGNFLSLDGTGASPGASSTTETTTLATKPATGQVYTFTPPGTPPAAPTNLTFSSITGSGMTLNWTDNSTGEAGFAILRSTDGINYTWVTTTASNAVSYAATGLNFGTLYYWQVYAVTEGVGSSAVSGSQSTNAATMSGDIPVGASSTYTTLTAAFNAINTNGLAGNVNLILQADYTSGGESTPIVSSNAQAAGTFTITIYPAVTGLAITGSNATAILDLNNAKNVILDGRVGATGTTKSLVIENTNLGGSTIRFINDATSNTVKYCIIKGVVTTSTSGVILFSTTTGTTGNDNNTIDNCDIGEGATLPVHCVYSAGTTTTTALNNSDNTISNCNIFNFFRADGQSSGVLISTGNTDWLIQNNHFYQTAARTHTTTSGLYRVISIETTAGNNFRVIGNYVGGSTSHAGGTAWTQSGSGNNFLGIRMSCGTTTASSVQGNTIKNISISTSTTSTTSACISVTSGSVNVGTVTGNTIGDMSATGSIVWTGTGTGANFKGINFESSGVADIQNNSVGGITVDGAGTTLFRAIQVSSGSTGNFQVVSNNTVGGSVANSISNSTNHDTYGIHTSSTTPNYTIANNIVRNITATSTGTAGELWGIYTQGALSNITGNTVTNLSTATTSTTIQMIGIAVSNTSSNNNLVAQNTVHSLTQSNSGAGTTHHSYGIYINVGTTTASTVSRNLIHSLKLSTTGSAITTQIRGIDILAGAANVINNMIRVGIDADGNSVTGNYFVQGISLQSTGTCNIYHNSVYVGGSGVGAGSQPTHALRRSGASGTHDFKNNILVNARSNSTGTGKHYAILTNGTTTITSNYNLFHVTGTGGVFGSSDNGTTDRATLNAWQSATGFDGNSGHGNPNFISPTGTTATVDLHVQSPTPAEGSGTTIASVTDDFDGQTRSSFTPVDIGADAGNFTASDIFPPVIAHTAVGNTSSTGIRTISATISDATGIPTSGGLVPRVYYKKLAAGSWFSQPGTLTSGGGTSGTWDFVIDIAGLAVNDSVYYYLIAQDQAGSPNIGSNPAGAVATDVNTVTTPPVPNVYKILAALAGAKTVGTLGGEDYSSLKAAFDAINNSVIIGNLTLTVTSNLTETATALLNPVTYDGGPFTITVKPSATLSNAVATPTISGSIGGALIRLDGADNVIIDGSNSVGGTSRDMTIQNLSNLASTAAIWISSKGTGAGATNITIKNCNIAAGSRQDTAANTTFGILMGGASLATSSAGENNDNNTFTNNAITKARYGIYCFGGSVASNTGLNITNNIIGPAAHGADQIGKGGIVIASQSGPTVSQNEIRFVGGPYASVSGGTDRVGIALATDAAWTPTTTPVKNAVVTRNLIHDIRDERTFSSVGIAVGGTDASTTNNLIANNMMYNLLANGTSGDQALGIGVAAGNGDRVVFNTIYLTGDTDPNASASAPTTSSAGIRISNTSATNLTLKNNIVYMDLSSTSAPTLKHACIDIPSSYAWGTGGSNYNDLYYLGSNAQSNTGSVASTTFHLTLANWQAATTQDANSVYQLPVFVSATDLHLAGGSLGDPLLKGIPIAGVSDDFDGQARDAQAPYMGADEATPPLPVQLASFTGRILPNNGGVSLAWRTLSEINNYGFFVQRRLANADQWSTISELIPGHGTTNDPHDYSYVDTRVPSLGTYQYRLKQVDMDGSFNYSEPISITLGPTSVLEDAPRVFALLQNYPNPFNPSTEIKFSVENTGRATLEVFNLLGQKVATLFDDVADAGRYYRVSVNATNFASGMYIYRLQSGSRVDVKKMLLMK